ncbi:BQ2448_576 [Microbotryum intermedium]|uniref:BQ2448_576 protein n=1 Tax=Microbotryum intermedium TaxID=269621 RepID=A0A238F5P7_9BASI|nr:BQ2448_576 [Microbotryum intermedium]
MVIPSPLIDGLTSLDLSRLLGGHAVLSLLTNLSNAPVWNLPLSLYGLVVVSHHADDGGDSIRQFAALYAFSFFLDALWLLSNQTYTATWFFIVVNFLLKPVTLLSTLGHLRQRGYATFNLPGGFSLPGASDHFGGHDGFPPARTGANETMWQAPSGVGSYHERSFSQEEHGVPSPSTAAAAPTTAPPSASRPVGPTSSGGNAGAKGYQGRSEGGGYHTLE